MCLRKGSKFIMRHKCRWLYPPLLLLGALLMLMFRVKRSVAQPPLDMAIIDQFVAKQLAVQRVPGLALAITQGDQVLHLKGYGTAGAGQPMTPQTRFFVASVSKSFTALAVMQLVEAGQLDLDAPVQSYLPEFTLADPAVAAQITTRQLLNHTSGLADSGFPQISSLQSTTIEQQIEQLRAAEPVAAPGTEFHYFDGNYQMLARVVEVVSGEPFSEYLQTHIFAPLQMAHTFNAITATEAKQRADRLAQGYLIAYGIPIAANELTGYIGGSGGVISTAEDMANYLIMQNSDGRFASATLLSPAGIALMHTPPTAIDSNYAMGWIETTNNGLRVLEHNGVLSVFYTDIVLLPETGHGFVLLYNTSSLAANVLASPAIKNGLIALLMGGQPAPQPYSVSLWAMLMGVITLIGMGLAIRSMIRLSGWSARTRHLPLWRLIPGMLWTFVPAGVLLGLPWLITATSGRSFTFVQLFRSMAEIFVWLGVCGVLGVINGIARIGILVRTRYI
jgi:CubicO group peptidase (beta-lactamase class C family)